MRYLQCKCGEAQMWTTDGVQPCQGCEKCQTTFAGRPENHKPLERHKPKVRYDQNTGKPKPYFRCEICMAACTEDGTYYRGDKK